VTGAISKTAEKATSQLEIQDLNHCPINGDPASSTRAVAIADTIADIRPDRINPNRIGAKRAEIMA